MQPSSSWSCRSRGSMSVLDTGGGRDRAVRAAKWTGGSIPFGYDPDGRLMPSNRHVGGAGLTESQIAASVFEKLAGGSSTVVECRRLNALGGSTARRYSSKGEVTVGDDWLPSRINSMIKNLVYRGSHVYKSKSGPIERPVPPLVDAETWHRANAQLKKNRALSTRNAKRAYLLLG